MTPREVNALLAHAGLVDLRIAALLRDSEGEQPGIQAARVATEWHKYLEPFGYVDALAAMHKHYSESQATLMPAHLVAALGRVERRDKAPFWMKSIESGES